MFLRLSQLLPVALRKKHIEKEVSAVRVMASAKAVFQQHFGVAIFDHVQLRYVKGSTLFLSASSSVVAQEVRLKQNVLLQELNRRIAPLRIEKFGFVI